MDNNIFNMISTRRNQLLIQKGNLTTEYKQKLAEIDSELNDLDNTIKIICKAIQPNICPVCKGSGYTRRCDAAGQMEDVKCDTCHGTGIKQTD